MKTSLLHAIVLAAAAALLVPPTGPSQAAARPPQPKKLPPVPLPLKTGSPYLMCLTDESTRALAESGMRLQAVAPVTLVTHEGHRCLRWTLTGGHLNGDLSGVSTEARGGFVLRRGVRRALFTDARTTLTVSDSTARVSMLHHRRRTEVLVAPAANISLSLADGFRTSNNPTALTPAAARAIAADIPGSPFRANDEIFTTNAQIGVLPTGIPLPAGRK
ncbi:hypothetical protein [Streptomyces sp. UNOC14_S4]|uniref:hypothetical protein n=1 Tax=Streptomyces sp. UNOC14_S4 TaxID=2872340 RepID=UPI001E650758|nr:hypothetical protein [Streptomyces sp. UNOC14_S4]MCC3770927.1 hypothetical protein [Streptomyces sp. UNOC14_S4]